VYYLIQRQLIAQKMKQKRQTGASGMVQASNVSSTQLTYHSNKWTNSNKELHGNINECSIINIS